MNVKRASSNPYCRHGLLCATLSDLDEAFTANVDYDVATSGDCAVMCCGGEGIFNAKFTATNSPGLVLVQSMSLEKLKALFARPRPPPQDNSPAGLAGEAQGLV